MRKTKIICTVGPTSQEESILRRMIDAGMNLSRHNFSHGTNEDHRIKITRVREAARALGKTVAILVDTKGPEIRTHKFENAPVFVREGDIIDVISGGVKVLGNSKQFSTTYDMCHIDLKPGSRILIDDGQIALDVVEIEDNTLKCRVLNDGVISDNKGINLPGIKTQLKSLTEKDIEDLKFSVELGVDIVAASFIRKAEDVLAIRKVLRNFGGDDIFLMSKIENQEGVDNIEEIIRYSDGIMVARGDLGVEIPPERVPVIQKRIIDMCNESGKPVVTATQMLESMVRLPRPTRAEVSDVTNAIFDGTDCIMLSGETANGKYPVEAVETMARIAEFAEKNINYERIREKNRKITMSSVPMAICHASVNTAWEIGAEVIISATVSGSTARNVSRFRPESPIVAITPSEVVARKLAIYWGVFPIVSEIFNSTDEMIERTAGIAKEHGFVTDGDLAVITAGLPMNQVGSTNMVKVHLIGEVLLQGKRTNITTQIVSGVVTKAATAEEARGKVRSGDILVVESLTDDFLDILQGVSGIIVETRYVTPEISVEALRMDIPIIAEARNALSILTEGTLVTIDGKRSLVIKGHTKLKS